MGNRTRIKICGITCADDALAAVGAGVDALGFVHYQPSPRHTELVQINNICAQLPPFVSLVALLVNPNMDTIRYIEQSTSIDTIQFHGDETPDFLADVKLPYYKKITLNTITVDQAAVKYRAARALLADTPVAADTIPGGSGKTFDWSLAKRRTSKPFILAGGLSSDNIISAIEKTQPYAVDINSGVEAAPGKKSAEKIQQLVYLVRQTDTL